MAIGCAFLALSSADCVQGASQQSPSKPAYGSCCCSGEGQAGVGRMFAPGPMTVLAALCTTCSVRVRLGGSPCSPFTFFVFHLFGAIAGAARQQSPCLNGGDNCITIFPACVVQNPSKQSRSPVECRWAAAPEAAALQGGPLIVCTAGCARRMKGLKPALCAHTNSAFSSTICLRM